MGFQSAPSSMKKYCLAYRNSIHNLTAASLGNKKWHPSVVLTTTRMIATICRKYVSIHIYIHIYVCKCICISQRVLNNTVPQPVGKLLVQKPYFVLCSYFGPYGSMHIRGCPKFVKWCTVWRASIIRTLFFKHRNAYTYIYICTHIGLPLVGKLPCIPLSHVRLSARKSLSERIARKVFWQLR